MHDSDWSDFVRDLARPCPEAKGTRIELVSMGSDPDPILPGAKGTVSGGSGAQLWVDWDDGRALNLLLPQDRYRVISDA